MKRIHSSINKTTNSTEVKFEEDPDLFSPKIQKVVDRSLHNQKPLDIPGLPLPYLKPCSDSERPLPNFDLCMTPSENRKLPPRAPNKKYTMNRANLERNNSIFLSAKKQLERQGFTLNLVGQGDYHNVFSIDSQEKILVQGIKNQNIIIRILNDYALTSVKKPETLVQTAYQQYTRIKNALNVVMVYNHPPSDGYWSVQKVDTNVNLKIPKEGHITDQETLKLLEQLAVFYQYVFKFREHLDLTINNFGLDADNNLTLIDFREEEDEDDYTIDAEKSMEKLFFKNTEAFAQFQAMVEAAIVSELPGKGC